MVAGEHTSNAARGSAEVSSSGGPSYPAPQSIVYPGAFGGGPTQYGGYPYPSPVHYGYAPHGAVYGGNLPGQVGHVRVALPQIVYYPAYAPGPYPQNAYRPAGFAPYPERGAGTQDGRFALAPELSAPSTRSLPQLYALDDISRFAGQVARPGVGAGLPINPPAKTDRWFVDVFGFYRQGSAGLSLPQGPLPIYGASQIASNLQWRARPSSSHDPRVFLRAYQAQVEGGESEIAAGVSGRPIGHIPVRLFGELRATQSTAVSGTDVGVQTKFRPAVYAATELPPIKLPAGFSLEAYGAGGYVAGSPSTYFVDGQAVASRELLRVGRPGRGGAVSVGGGIWGGAQRDARRLDVGPTLRFDVDIGKLPARVSVDYREKVAGDAEPDSGVAATVSTRF